MMTKQELSSALAEKEQFTVARASNIINSVFEIIANELKNGENVKIRHFGTFLVSESKPRNFKNPKTKEEGIVTEHKRPVFISSRTLRNQINSEDNDSE